MASLSTSPAVSLGIRSLEGSHKEPVYLPLTVPPVSNTPRPCSRARDHRGWGGVTQTRSSRLFLVKLEERGSSH